MTDTASSDTKHPTVRDLLERYEQNKERSDPATAMIDACDEILDEMDGDRDD